MYEIIKILYYFERKKKTLTSIFLMITLLPLVYKKFFPLGSPPNTRGCPLWVLGNAANIYSVNDIFKLKRNGEIKISLLTNKSTRVFSK